ncbi:MAG: holo-ACP synthase [Deltaproteobacteria bacterium]
MVGTGMDLAEVERTLAAVDGRHGARFRDRVYTAEEQRYCDSRGRGRGQSYAARFAAKEATMKALGVGWGKDAGFSEIEVRREPQGRPSLLLSGAAAATASRMGITHLHLSLTHTAGLAGAFVVAEQEPAADSD